MNTKEQLLKECEELSIIGIEADSLNESTIKDAIEAVKESQPYVKKAIKETLEELGETKELLEELGETRNV